MKSLSRMVSTTTHPEPLHRTAKTNNQAGVQKTRTNGHDSSLNMTSHALKEVAQDTSTQMIQL